MIETPYYVYIVHYDKKILYVGSGQGNRKDHVTSCRSHNAYLNRFFAFGYIEDLFSIEVIDTPTRKDADILEIKSIRDLNPIFNIKDNCQFNLDRIEYHLEQHANDRILDALKWEKSKPYVSTYKEIIADLDKELEDTKNFYENQILNLKRQIEELQNDKKLMRETIHLGLDNYAVKRNNDHVAR